jgi:hypothetical protein
MSSTALQEFIGAIWALIPGVTPYLLFAWVAAIVAMIVSLAIDERHGDRTRRSSLRAAWLGLRLGVLLTFIVIATEARWQGLISADVLNFFGGALSIGFGFSFNKSRRAELDVHAERRG